MSGASRVTSQIASQVTAMVGGDPASQARALRSCLAQFATGVTVVTARGQDGIVGVTANSFSSVSLDPPLVLWSIDRKSRSFATFESATHFAVNVLANDQIALSQTFARSAQDKFAGIDWHPGVHGSPILDRAAATFECRLEAAYDGGDHLILLGLVERFEHRPASPLLFVQGRYAVAQEHPQLTSPQPRDEPPLEQSDSAPDIVTLLFWASHLSSRAFEKHRQAEGLTFVESRVIYALHDRSVIDVEELVRRIDIPAVVVRDAVAELCARSAIQRDKSGALALTASGRQRREAIVDRTAAFSAESLQWASARTLDAVRGFLQEYARRLSTDTNGAAPPVE